MIQLQGVVRNPPKRAPDDRLRDRCALRKIRVRCAEVAARGSSAPQGQREGGETPPQDGRAGAAEL